MNGEGLADEGNLAAVGHDDADGLRGVEMGFCEAVDTDEEVGDDTGLLFLGRSVAGRWGRYKNDAAALQQLVQLVAGREGVAQQCLLLVRQGHGLQLFALVEMQQGETGHVGVHAAVGVESADELCAPLPVLPA